MRASQKKNCTINYDNVFREHADDDIFKINNKKTDLNITFKSLSSMSKL